MIAVILPLVKTAPRTRPSLLLLLFGSAAVVSAALVGLALGIVGDAFQQPLSERQAVAIIGVAALLLALGDLGVRPFRTPMIRRQTQPWWFHRFGGRVAYVLWGLDLGLGFSTFRTTSLYWLTLVCVVTTLDPLHATIVGGFYGIGLSIAVTISFLLFRRRNDNPLDPAHMLLRRSAPTRRAAGILLAGISLTLLVGLVN